LLTQEELDKKNNSSGTKAKGKQPKKKANEFFDQLRSNANSQVCFLPNGFSAIWLISSHWSRPNNL
jgi:hypothetical protein